jgi:FkbM family methyltransferase
MNLLTRISQMGPNFRQRLWEAVRCTRHNWLHLRMFKVQYRGREWHVLDRDGLHLRFPFYPYLVFFEIEGYLRQSRWRIEEGMTVIDAGGCAGEFSLYAARKVGDSGRVLMLEPDQDNIERAHEVFELNGGKPDNLEIIRAGLWKERGALSFAAGLGPISTLVTPGESVPQAARVTNIPVHSAASLVAEYKAKRVDIVKMDIEGAEVQVMETAGDFVRQFSPRFSIASYHRYQNGITRDALEPIFRQLGYQCQTGFPEHLTTWAAPVL